MSQFRAPARSVPTQTVPPPVFESEAANVLSVFQSLTGTIGTATSALNQATARSRREQAIEKAQDEDVGALILARGGPGMLSRVDRGEFDSFQGTDEELVEHLTNELLKDFPKASQHTINAVHSGLAGDAAKRIVRRRNKLDLDAAAVTLEAATDRAVGKSGEALKQHAKETQALLPFHVPERELMIRFLMGKLESAAAAGDGGRFRAATEELRAISPVDQEEAIRSMRRILNAEEGRAAADTLTFFEADINALDPDEIEAMDPEQRVRDVGLDPKSPQGLRLKALLEAAQKAETKEKRAEIFRNGLEQIKAKENEGEFVDREAALEFLSKELLMTETQRSTLALEAEQNFNRNQRDRLNAANNFLIGTMQAAPKAAASASVTAAAASIEATPAHPEYPALIESLERTKAQFVNRQNQQAFDTTRDQIVADQVTANANMALDQLMVPGATIHSITESTSVAVATPTGMRQESVSEEQRRAALWQVFEQRMAQETNPDGSALTDTQKLARRFEFAGLKLVPYPPHEKFLAGGSAIAIPEEANISDLQQRDENGRPLNDLTALVDKAKLASMMRRTSQRAEVLDLHTNPRDMAFYKDVDSVLRHNEHLGWEGAILKVARADASQRNVTPQEKRAVISKMDKADVDTGLEENLIESVILSKKIAGLGGDALTTESVRILEEEYLNWTGKLVYTKGIAPPGSDLNAFLTLAADSWWQSGKAKGSGVPREHVTWDFNENTGTLHMITVTGELVPNGSRYDRNQIDEFFAAYNEEQEIKEAYQDRFFNHSQALNRRLMNTFIAFMPLGGKATEFLFRRADFRRSEAEGPPGGIELTKDPDIILSQAELEQDVEATIARLLTESRFTPLPDHHKIGDIPMHAIRRWRDTEIRTAPLFRVKTQLEHELEEVNRFFVPGPSFP